MKKNIFLPLLLFVGLSSPALFCMEKRITHEVQRELNASGERALTPASKKRKNPVARYFCPRCAECHGDKRTVMEHKKSKPNVPSIQCPQCKCLFNHATSYEMHASQCRPLPLLQASNNVTILAEPAALEEHDTTSPNMVDFPAEVLEEFEQTQANISSIDYTQETTLQAASDPQDAQIAAQQPINATNHEQSSIMSIDMHNHQLVSPTIASPNEVQNTVGWMVFSPDGTTLPPLTYPLLQKTPSLTANTNARLLADRDNLPDLFLCPTLMLQPSLRSSFSRVPSQLLHSPNPLTENAELSLSQVASIIP